MVTVLRGNGLEVRIYAGDSEHGPAHVHVLRAPSEAIFELNCPAGPVSLRANYGFSTRELYKIADWLNQNLTFLCDEWRRIHGDK